MTAQDIYRQLPKRELTLTTLVTAMAIVMIEIDRLIGRAGVGYTASMIDASSLRSPVPLPTGESYPWLTLHRLDQSAHGLVLAFTAADLIFLVAYALLFYGLLARVADSGVVGEMAPFKVLTRPRPWMAWAAAGADLVEDALLVILVLNGSPDEPMNGWLASAVAVATSIKWLALFLALGPLLYAVFGTPKGREKLVRWLRAFYQQRFSLLAVLPVVALALVPGAGIFDQLPDIQRAWFELGDRGWQGPTHALVATLLLGAVTFGVFVLGRLFTDEAIRRVEDPGPLPRTILRQWLYGPVVVGVAAVVATALGGEVRFGPLILFCAVPLSIVVSSWIVRRRGQATVPPRLPSDLPLSEIWRAGDLLALAGLVGASLGLVRSCTVMVFAPEGNAVQRVMPLLGLAGALAIWLVGIRVLERFGRLIPLVNELIKPGEGAGLHRSADDAVDARPPAAREQRRPWQLAWVSILLSTACLAALALWPVHLGNALGALGSVMFALGNLILLVGASAALHALWAPPDVFWTGKLRLRGTPVVTLLLAAVLAAGLGGSTPKVHGLREGGQQPTAGMTFEVAVDGWKSRTEGCTVEVDGKQFRPLILLASEGGGIRAAYWTAAALDVLARETRCGVDAIAVASGVSGGSVGLATARASKTGGAGEAVWRMGGDDALAQATLGLLVRDPANTVTGVAAPVDGRWLDRAGLMEVAWEQAIPGLGTNFYGPPLSDALPAPLILNSTDATSGCRVLVTQLEVGDGGAALCADAAAPLPYSRDFRSYLGNSQECPTGLRLSTAAMLSARFPYVTPSAVVGPCGAAPVGQLIDGGYAEGSGLGSLVDVAPRLLAEVKGDRTELPVLPILVYLDNGLPDDRTSAPPETHPELLVPPLGALVAGGTQKSPTAWLQRAAALSVGRVNVEATKVFVVAQDSQSAVEAPMGWVLSRASRTSMDSSLGREVASCKAGDIGASGTRYPGMAGLLDLFGACP